MIKHTIISRLDGALSKGQTSLFITDRPRSDPDRLGRRRARRCRIQRSQGQSQACPAAIEPQLGTASQHRERLVHIPVRLQPHLAARPADTQPATSSAATSASSAYATAPIRASSPLHTSPTSPRSSRPFISRSSTSRPHAGHTPSLSSTRSSSARRRHTRTRARHRTWTS